MRIKICLVIFICLALISLSVSQPAAGEDTIVIEDIHGTLTESDSEALDINDNGQIVGVSYNGLGAPKSGFLRNSDGTIVDLGAYLTQARAINNLAQIAGTSTASGNSHAYVLNPDFTGTDLGTLGGPTSLANDINNCGQVAGAADYAFAHARAFIWSTDDGMVDLGGLAGADSIAYGLNDIGQVVGVSNNQAVLWNPDLVGGYTITALGSLTAYPYSAAYGINNLGQVVGYSLTDTFTLHAFIWEDGVMTDLGPLGTSDLYGAIDINDNEQIVGYGQAGSQYPLLWEDGVITELDMLDGGKGTAVSINNNGQIVGSSYISTGETHAVLWSVPQPTPEELLETISTEIDAMIPSGDLNEKQGNALYATINAAERQLEKDNPNAVINILGAFQNQLEAFTKAGKITEEAAAVLAAMADDIIAELSV